MGYVAEYRGRIGRSGLTGMWRQAPRHLGILDEGGGADRLTEGVFMRKRQTVIRGLQMAS